MVEEELILNVMIIVIVIIIIMMIIMWQSRSATQSGGCCGEAEGEALALALEGTVQVGTWKDMIMPMTITSPKNGRVIDTSAKFTIHLIDPKRLLFPQSILPSAFVSYISIGKCM